jgi:hypothetical protein
MPSTHRDNGVSMGGTLKRLSTLKKLKHFGGLKRPGKLVSLNHPSMRPAVRYVTHIAQKCWLETVYFSQPAGDGPQAHSEVFPPDEASKRLRLLSRLFHKDAAAEDDVAEAEATAQAVEERIMDSMAAHFSFVLDHCGYQKWPNEGGAALSITPRQSASTWIAAAVPLSELGSVLSATLTRGMYAHSWGSALPDPMPLSPSAFASSICASCGSCLTCSQYSSARSRLLSFDYNI